MRLSSDNKLLLLLLSTKNWDWFLLEFLIVFDEPNFRNFFMLASGLALWSPSAMMSDTKCVCYHTWYIRSQHPRDFFEFQQTASDSTSLVALGLERRWSILGHGVYDRRDSSFPFLGAIVGFLFPFSCSCKTLPHLVRSCKASLSHLSLAFTLHTSTLGFFFTLGDRRRSCSWCWAKVLMSMCCSFYVVRS